MTSDHSAESKTDILFRLYAQRLTNLAEQHLSRKIAQRVDVEDIVQSVFRTFFRRSSEGEFQIDDSVELWQLLVTITLRKTAMKARHHSADKRNVQAEHRGDVDAWLASSAGREPRPDEAAVLVDEIEKALDGLPEAYCKMLAMRLEGYSPTEISKEMNISRQSVYRALELMQKRLQEEK